MAVKISLDKLIETGAHFGHQTKRWNPKISSFLYGKEGGVHVFDLIKTKEALEEAVKVLADALKAKKTVLFVGTKKQAKERLKELAVSVNMPYINERWLGGIITNFEQIKRSIKKLADMKATMAAGEYNKFTKKERLLIEREILRLERFVGGLSLLTKKPDLLFIVDTHKEKGAVAEGIKTGVPIVGIVDSNSDPTQVDYPIPMNDDSSKALDYVLGLIGGNLNGK